MINDNQIVDEMFLMLQEQLNLRFLEGAWFVQDNRELIFEISESIRFGFYISQKQGKDEGDTK